MTTEDAIQFNIRAHNKIVARYEKNHTEIFNEIEQARIAHTIAQVIEAAGSDKNTLKAIDVGCGSGNLTAHLIDPVPPPPCIIGPVYGTSFGSIRWLSSTLIVRSR